MNGRAKVIGEHRPAVNRKRFDYAHIEERWQLGLKASRHAPADFGDNDGQNRARAR
ncbi:hypothetical protein [Caballeronia sp. LZ034LL]|uniref:hypothetical protein n=1 Tax=Caballeronia sp. LZ034LL TaxID=3038567 RepID=UPI00285F18D0|nr:hypothetical protein [Caballeronia sp. LZ034LL]MDR5833410.1 hypothetical protein [Caballeronia sp. LZ034LL]